MFLFAWLPPFPAQMVSSMSHGNSDFSKSHVATESHSRSTFDQSLLCVCVSVCSSMRMHSLTACYVCFFFFFFFYTLYGHIYVYIILCVRVLCCSSAPFFLPMLNKQMPKVTLKIFRKISLNDLLPKEHTYATRIEITTNTNRKARDRTGPSPFSLSLLSSSSSSLQLVSHIFFLALISLFFLFIFLFFFAFIVSFLADCTPSCASFVCCEANKFSIYDFSS